MDVNISSLGFYEDVYQTLQRAMRWALEVQLRAERSPDPDSDYQRARAIEDEINQLVRRLALMDLQRIDEEIAKSGIVAEIGELTKEAKEEADAIDNATKTVKRIADVVGKIAGVVTKISGLPFL